MLPRGQLRLCGVQEERQAKPREDCCRGPRSARLELMTLMTLDDTDAGDQPIDNVRSFGIITPHWAQQPLRQGLLAFSFLIHFRDSAPCRGSRVDRSTPRYLSWSGLVRSRLPCFLNVPLKLPSTRTRPELRTHHGRPHKCMSTYLSSAGIRRLRAVTKCALPPNRKSRLHDHRRRDGFKGNTCAMRLQRLSLVDIVVVEARRSRRQVLRYSNILNFRA
jgi:hypothetical protein